MRKLPRTRRLNEEIELRQVEEQDAEAFFLLIERNRQHLRTWLGWLDNVHTIEDERDFLRMSYSQFLEDRAASYAILHQGKLIGNINFHPINWQHGRAEIGYMLDSAHEGHGIMTLACQTLLTIAFDDLQLNKVEIRCATGNTRSCAIPRRLGFVEEGVLRHAELLYDHYIDHRLFGMLASEWRARQAVSNWLAE
ncbi:GNAT family N-acetyltransferase [Ktedonospora formicarum]|uniref:GNAT family N-acetyltransferase n=1 Tax=Ktedonospora formicarum TaxID=2778364 RepID=UPI001C68F6E1|nr:GNAT family protein [Ktedonospora formicarum]